MDDIIINNPENWLLEKLYNANRPDFETYRVFQVYRRYINDTREFIGVAEETSPGNLRFKPLNDLAYDCLFGVTFFKKTIKRRQTRRGAPGVSFYSYAGKHAFEQIGYPTISSNWDFWIEYVNSTIKMHK